MNCYAVPRNILGFPEEEPQACAAADVTPPQKQEPVVAETVGSEDYRIARTTPPSTRSAAPVVAEARGLPR